MESDQLDDNGNYGKDTYIMHSVSPSSPDIGYMVEIPQLNPRIGDDYQAKIPSTMAESEHIQFSKNPIDSGVIFHDWKLSAAGLPVPIMWACDKMDSVGDQQGNLMSSVDGAINIPRPTQARNMKRNYISKDKAQDQNFESQDVGEDKGKLSIPAILGSVSPREEESGQCHKCRNCFAFPGQICSPWTDADGKCFLLGLFIFGKNFIQIKKFLGNKGMGEILSYYYGKFYRSDGYRRWSNCRKVKDRKCMIGQKMLTGSRNRELLSRLLPHVSEDLQNTLMEVSDSYVDGRASLEEYVSFLKSAVGLYVLVEAVAIGKGKEDLTRLAMEHSKNNQGLPINGKSLSALEPDDIIKYLSGGFRLSKARYNDIFWEAVWPRLLARGWHSEQPKNQGYISKDHLVFLVPGIQKFSRRKLVKGNDYFDSVSDVLTKVISEPRLLELEAEDAKFGSCNLKNGLILEASSDGEDAYDTFRHCYLKPRVSVYRSDNMKFTIVDTSSVLEGKPSSVREMRYLPLKLKITSSFPNQLSETENVSDEEFLDKVDMDADDVPLIAYQNANKAYRRQRILCATNEKSKKFTVVDTSLLDEGKSSVTELRCLPFPLKSTSKLNGLTGGCCGQCCPSKDLLRESSANNMPLGEMKNTVNGKCNMDASFEDDTNKEVAYDNFDIGKNKFLESSQYQQSSISDDKQQRRNIKRQFFRREKYGNSSRAAPLVKRRKLTACVKSEASCISKNSLEGTTTTKRNGLSMPNVSKNLSSHVSPEENASSIVASIKDRLEEEKNESIVDRGCFSMENSGVKFEEGESEAKINLNMAQDPPIPKDSPVIFEKGEPEATINLNMAQDPPKPKDSHVKFEKGKLEATINLNTHHIPPKPENDVFADIMGGEGESIKEDNPCHTTDGKKLDPEALRTFNDVDSAVRQPGINPRRKSTRNRPLTVRALECIANEFLHVQRKRREVQRREKSFNPCRKARSRIKVVSRHVSAGPATEFPMEGKHSNEECNINIEKDSKNLHPIEE